MENAHTLPIEELLAELETDKDRGLSAAAVAARLEKYGPNELPEEKRPSVLWLFFKQFHSGLTYVLFGAAAIATFLHEYKDAAGIIVVILGDVIFSFIQERRAESALEKLKQMVVHETSVIRDGRVQRVPSSRLVPGDIIQLTEGDRVTTDARLIKAKELAVDESSLTGESLPVRKAAGIVRLDAPLAERPPMVHMGTSVVSGVGRAVVVQTGPRTEFGRIAGSLQEIKHERAPFEENIDRLGRNLALLTVGLAALVFVMGYWQGSTFGEMFFFAVALGVSVMPEGLPAVLTVVLALGVQRMAKRNAIVRHVPSVETLGATDVICTDKTGTLTENKMTVREIDLAGRRVCVTGEGWDPEGDFLVDERLVRPTENPVLSLLIKAAAVCNDADLEWRDGRPVAVGDPTEAALVVLGAKAGIEKHKLEHEFRTVDELPFRSSRMFRAVLGESVDLHGKSTRMLFVVGAYGVVKRRSALAQVDGDARPFEEVQESFDKTNERMAGDALRVLAVAYKEMPADKDSLTDEDVADLTLLGQIGMIDPPRAGVGPSLERCRQAGIRVIMLTGDQRATAVAVAREVGLLPAGETEGVYVEKDIADLDEQAFKQMLGKARILARVTPSMKLRIVTALQEMGQTVAMTGDGVNDAPALKKAAIGVSMGLVGTDVSREVADMVLADDDFTTIVNAVEEGRVVFRNVKMTTAYLFTTNIAEVVTVVAALAAGLPLPLLPAQLLWMNLVTDGLPDVALATEPSSPEVLSEPPRRRGSGLITRNTLILAGVSSVLMGVGTLLLFNWALRIDGGLNYARTVAFTTMAVFQLWNVFNMRSATESIFKLGWLSNRFVFISVVASLGLQLAVIYFPPLRRTFRLEVLGLGEWAMIGLITFSIILVTEVYKLGLRRGLIPRSWI